MIGLLRPYKPGLARAHLPALSRLHCAGCTLMRARSSWPAALAYSYETDVLIALFGAFGLIPAREQRRHLCTALPVIPRSTLDFPEELAQTVNAFAIVAGWAVAADHVADGDSKLDWLLKRTLEPHLEPSLRVLRIQAGEPPDPRLLQEVDAAGVCTWRQYVQAYDPFVRGLWLAAFEAAGRSTLSGPRGEAVADRLGRVTTLADLWADRREDELAGRPNPLVHNAAAAEEALHQIRTDLAELLVLTADGVSPFRDILQNVFAVGTIHRLERQARQKGVLP